MCLFRKVTIKRGQVVDIWSPSLSITCRSQDFLCLLKLSNYHKSGVIGLLGNADESSTNDFMVRNIIFGEKFSSS